jgi:succinate-semialdehyde dehydrogenase/glutarate-semialdehyde dehydrogenase
MTSRADYSPLALFIAGEWIAEGRETQPVINPATGEALAALPLATPEDLDRAVQAASTSFKTWQRVSALERGAILRRAADILRDEVEANAAVLTLEQGKPLAHALTEWAACADAFDWAAEEARRIYGRVIPSRVAGMTLQALREPVGPVAAFAPWNFPASQVARKLAPALAAGCTVVIKPSEETPGSALALARALEKAGLPPGVLNVVFGRPADVAERLIQAPDIRKVSFTGSTPVGRLIAAQAAAGLKRVTLELGGHAPVLVFDDADVEAAVSLSARFKLRNTGQMCNAPTRFLVQRKVHDQFVAALGAAMAAVPVGDGMDPATVMGPLSNPRRVEAMAALAADAVDRGGRLVTGGTAPSRPGYFWPPTLIDGAPLDCRAMNEEPFGPLALTRRFDEPEEAFAEANRLPYGLAAYVFTQSLALADRARRELECGLVGLNTFAVTWAETPFGGIKDSGYGSEGGSEGLDAYLTTKFVSQA